MNAVKPGYVYFLHAVNSGDSDGMERYKIGLTTRYVEDRLKELNSGQSPFWLVEKWSIQVSDCDAVESALHKHFASRRLYFNTSNGTTGKYHEIDSADRKSTEWFMFAESELPSVEESYQNIQNQYEWQMLSPNKKQQREQQKQSVQDDRQWQYVNDRYVAVNRQSSGGGWGIALTFGAALLLIVPRLGGFSELVNAPRSNGGSFGLPPLSLPKMPNVPKMPGNPIDGVVSWLSSPFAQKQGIINASPNTGVNIRSSPNGPIVGYVANGDAVAVKGRSGKWVNIGSGEWVWGEFVK